MSHTAAAATAGRRGLIALIAEASRHQVAVVNYCEQAHADAGRGKRHMAFWCLDMAALHRRHYAAARAAIARATRSAA